MAIEVWSLNESNEPITWPEEVDGSKSSASLPGAVDGLLAFRARRLGELAEVTRDEERVWVGFADT